MSKEITSGWPASSPNSAVASAAAGRAGFEQADREGARRGGRDQAAGGVHQPQRAAEAARGELALEPPR